MWCALKVVIVGLLMGSVSLGQTVSQDRRPTNRPDSPLVILHKPKAKYPVPEFGTVCIRGTVILRVQFLAGGLIGDIKVIKGLPYGATDNAIQAAKHIRFLPTSPLELAMPFGKRPETEFSIRRGVPTVLTPPPMSMPTGRMVP